MTPTPLQRARLRLQALVDTYPELRDPQAQARLEAWLAKEQQTMAERKALPKGDTTAYVRMKRMRERRKAEGWQPYEIWLCGEDAARLTEFKQPGESVSNAVARALRAAQGPTPLVGAGLGYDERKTALLTRIRAMHAQGLSGQKIADQLNAEEAPTLSGRGAWKKGTVYDLLKE